jgi:hypothetical protein
MAKMEGRKSSDDVRNEGEVARAKKKAHLEKIAAYDLKYKADALARREKLAAEAAAPKAA